MHKNKDLFSKVKTIFVTDMGCPTSHHKDMIDRIAPYADEALYYMVKDLDVKYRESKILSLSKSYVYLYNVSSSKRFSMSKYIPKYLGKKITSRI